MRSAQLTGLDVRHREVAREVLDGMSEQVRLACFSGSLTAGLGHTGSDLDIHIVLRDDMVPGSRTRLVDGVRVQLTVLSERRMRHIAELGRAFVATKSDRRQIQLDSVTLWDLMRIATSEFICADAEMHHLYHTVSTDVARQILMGNFAHRVARFAEDASGLAAAGDVDSAYWCSVLALQHGMQVAVAGAGDLYYPTKFLFARIRRSPLRDYADELADGVRAERAGAYVARRAAPALGCQCARGCRVARRVGPAVAARASIGPDRARANAFALLEPAAFRRLRGTRGGRGAAPSVARGRGTVGDAGRSRGHGAGGRVAGTRDRTVTRGRLRRR
jgi:hypothetical protein